MTNKKIETKKFGIETSGGPKKAHKDSIGATRNEDEGCLDHCVRRMAQD
jgi:hypothetical protein